MYDLEQMMETTKVMLKETKRREKALRWILHVLNLAEKQNILTPISIVLLLKYENERQKRLLKVMAEQNRISKRQKEEQEKSIQKYEKYMQFLISKLDF